MIRRKKTKPSFEITFIECTGKESKSIVAFPKDNVIFNGNDNEHLMRVEVLENKIKIVMLYPFLIPEPDVIEWAKRR